MCAWVYSTSAAVPWGARAARCSRSATRVVRARRRAAVSASGSVTGRGAGSWGGGAIRATGPEALPVPTPMPGRTVLMRPGPGTAAGPAPQGRLRRARLRRRVAGRRRALPRERVRTAGSRRPRGLVGAADGDLDGLAGRGLHKQGGRAGVEPVPRADGDQEVGHRDSFDGEGERQPRAGRAIAYVWGGGAVRKAARTAPSPNPRSGGAVSGRLCFPPEEGVFDGSTCTSRAMSTHSENQINALGSLVFPVAASKVSHRQASPHMKRT